jgi:ribosomal protein L1
MLLINGLIKGKLKKLGYKGLMATVEKGADGIHIKPLVKTYSARQLKIMLSDFHEVSINIKHLDKSNFSLFGKLLASALVKLLESKLGGFVIAKAVK